MCSLPFHSMLSLTFLFNFLLFSTILLHFPLFSTILFDCLLFSNVLFHFCSYLPFYSIFLLFSTVLFHVLLFFTISYLSLLFSVIVYTSLPCSSLYFRFLSSVLYTSDSIAPVNGLVLVVFKFVKTILCLTVLCWLIYEMFMEMTLNSEGCRLLDLMDLKGST
jgi:hypothetical protein